MLRGVTFTGGDPQNAPLPPRSTSRECESGLPRAAPLVAPATRAGAVSPLPGAYAGKKHASRGAHSVGGSAQPVRTNDGRHRASASPHLSDESVLHPHDTQLAKSRENSSAGAVPAPAARAPAPREAGTACLSCSLSAWPLPSPCAYDMRMSSFEHEPQKKNEHKQNFVQTKNFRPLERAEECSELAGSGRVCVKGFVCPCWGSVPSAGSAFPPAR
jgi:hypothetical protein